MTRTRRSTSTLAALAAAGALAACRPAAAPQTAPQPAARPAPAQLVTPPVLGSLGAHRLIPVPTSVTPGDGAPFAIAAGTTVVVPAGGGEAARVGEMLAAMLRPATGVGLAVAPGDGPALAGAIVLRLGGAATLGDEGYELTVSADSVRLVAARPAGLFRGVQTLRQLLPAGVESEQSAMRMAAAWTIPAGRITDRPRFAWRGAMLDVSRHFFTVKETKQFIDLLALYKMNVLHLHLSDDQGWRIVIDSWPKLATVGGASQVGGGPGGYYTKDDYREIVRYAQERFITVVPEIDMPAHTHAAIAAYPELGCSRPMPEPSPNAPPGFYTGIRVGWSALCHDKDVTYKFADDVIRELAELTPGPYIHIGGDEVEVLNHDQYVQFIERVQELVYKHGKTMVGWQEVGTARLRPTSIVQQWRSDTAPPAVRQGGAKLILSPAPKVYLDMKYTPATELGLRWAGFVELRTAYDWEPVTYAKGAPESAVLGVEAPLWSETIENISGAQYLTMPRLPAIAEVGWSDASAKDWEGFRARIAAHAPRWRFMGVNYYPTPQVAW